MYRRRGVNCEVVPQPAHETATDAWGNTFENWCTDAKLCDITPGNIVLAGCRPQDPDGLIPLWQHRDVDNNVRPLNPYVDSPLIPTGFLEDVIESDPDQILVLGLDQDRDLVVVTASGQQTFQLEAGTQVLSTASATT